MEKKTKIKFFQTKLFYGLVAVLASVCLWIYVVGVENPEKEKSVSGIAVNFVGEDFLMSEQSLMVMDSSVENVSITFRGKNSDLKKLDKDSVSVSVDLSTVSSTGGHSLLYDIVFPDDVDPSAIEIVSYSPQYIRVVTDKYSKTSIPITCELNGNIAEGYKAEECICEPEKLVISGPEEEISRIHHALVVMRHKDLDETVTDEYDFVFIDSEGNEFSSENVECDVEKIKVTQPIVVVKSIPLRVNYIEGGGAREANVISTIKPISSIVLSGDEDVLGTLNQIVLGTIDLSQISSNHSQEFSIPIPNGVENLSGVTEATVETEIIGLETKTFTITNIELENVTEGFEARSVTKKLDVLIRGPKMIIDLITEYNIRIVADLMDLDQATGNYTVPATIYIDGYSDAGAVGKYAVVVEVAEEGTFEKERTEAAETE